jgi:hypothetical protein
MNPAPFLSRHLGDYLLVAQLSEDALGTVFRALYAADERRFVRLRILRSEELSPEAVAWTVRGNALAAASLSHDAIVARQQLDLVEDIPFMTWDETAGWTLDTMLARVRAFGIRIPAEYALLIVERIAAALEHAAQASAGGAPLSHGILWPGFVSISHDAAVRVGGFGVSEGILPSLSGPRMTAEIAPYVAPEARGARAGANSDVYSLGAILVELLTGRKPSLETPSAELRAGDPRSDELGAFLSRCLAEPRERFASAAEAHRALQQIVTGNPFSLYTANLALFLYKLLNPEGQSAAPSSDWESTNPVVLASHEPPREAEAPPPLPAGAPRRRHDDLEAAEAEAAPPPQPAPLHPAPPADFAPAPAPVQAFATELLEGRRISGPVLPMAPAWRRPAAGLAAAAALTLGAFLVASQIQSIRDASLARNVRAEGPRPGTALPVLPVPVTASIPLAVPSAAPSLPPAGLVVAASRQAAAPARPARKVRPEQRQPTEDLRLRAALARIEADRVNARETAGDLFGEGRQHEEEGERLLRQRDYDAAQMAFSRAARLFQKAQELTWEERLRQSDLTALP